MLITAIEPRRKGFSDLYIDGEYAVKIDTMLLCEKRVKTGDVIEDLYLKQLIELSDERRAKERALNLITFREHSKKELVDKLKKDYCEDIAQRVSDKMQDLGLINDESFAKRYAAELLRKKQMAPRGIIYKLSEKGIDKELAQNIVEDLEVDTVQSAFELIQKKYPKACDDEKIHRRAVAYLQRMGYNWSDINVAMDRLTIDEY